MESFCRDIHGVIHVSTYHQIGATIRITSGLSSIQIRDGVGYNAFVHVFGLWNDRAQNQTQNLFK